MNRNHGLIALALCASLACNFVTTALGIQATPTPEATSAPTATSGLYIPEQCKGLPLATIPAATAQAGPTPVPLINPEVSVESQKQIFEELVQTINQVYVYPDFNGKDWAGITENYRKQVAGGLSTPEFYAAIQTMIYDLGDEHSYYLSPAEVAAEAVEFSGKSEYVGIGVYITPLLEKNRVSILSVYPDSPAEHSGLKVHDSILTADGLPMIKDGQDQSTIILGAECSAVVLTVQSPGEAPREITLVREKIHSQLPVEARLVQTSDGSKVGYLSLPTFYDETIPAQVTNALKEFGELDGLILDNRINGGGSGAVVEPILAHFASGTLGHFVSRTESFPFEIKSDPIYNSQTVPLVVLVGEDTVSFGEIFSGVLRDVGRAKIVGAPSLGNVEVMYAHEFADHSLLWIAQETFKPLHSTENWELTGIVPDVIAYADWDTITFETDPAVLAAVKLLGH
ncbi:MAG: PDZ domain-containing protein [Anaerolineales bacterium]|nr:PDZ domain-containing protein [Anaerolineales bacterium]